MLMLEYRRKDNELEAVMYTCHDVSNMKDKMMKKRITEYKIWNRTGTEQKKKDDLRLMIMIMMKHHNVNLFQRSK